VGAVQADVERVRRVREDGRGSRVPDLPAPSLTPGAHVRRVARRACRRARATLPRACCSAWTRSTQSNTLATACRAAVGRPHLPRRPVTHGRHRLRTATPPRGVACGSRLSEGDVISDLQRVLVTGAAGRIGRGVLDVLDREHIAATALVLEDPGDLAADRVVVGDAGSPAVAARAVEGADAVVHLAAIPTPMDDPAEVVFGTNTMATFAVLDAAGRAGVRRAVIASSQSAWGTAFAPFELHPVSLPVDS